jgi:hypothetical protein
MQSPLMLVVLAACLGGFAAWSWRWQQGVRRVQAIESSGERWEHVMDDYPMPAEAQRQPALSPTLVDTVTKANPFSPQRRAVPPPQGGADPGGQPRSAPRFIYKGRINLGTRQRAILEEAANKKTYFLEVGQEVAGFKVLDIAENQVVLSDLNTKIDLVVPLAKPAGP